MCKADNTIKVVTLDLQYVLCPKLQPKPKAVCRVKSSEVCFYMSVYIYQSVFPSERFYNNKQNVIKYFSK